MIRIFLMFAMHVTYMYGALCPVTDIPYIYLTYTIHTYR